MGGVTDQFMRRFKTEGCNKPKLVETADGSVKKLNKLKTLKQSV